MGNCENQCTNKKSNLIFEIEKSKLIEEPKIVKSQSLPVNKENSVS